MCHQTTYTHSCTHKIKTPRLLCSLASLPSIFHSVTKAKVPLLYPCPSCAVRLGQPITYPYQVPPAPAPAAQIIYQAAPVTVPAQPQPVQQIPGPGSYGTPLPKPSNSTAETRLEYRNGAWRPVVHYRFPSGSAVPPPVGASIPVAVPARAQVQVVPVQGVIGQGPGQAQATVNRPANIPSNQGWSRVHGVDTGPGPPGPQPSGNAGAFSITPNDNLGWGAPVFQLPAPQPGTQTQAAAASPSPSSSTPNPQIPQASQVLAPQLQTSTPTSTSLSAPAVGPPPNILAAAAIQAPLPTQTLQTPSSAPLPPPTITQVSQAQNQTQAPSSSSLSTPVQTPGHHPQTPNNAARNARAESLLGMNTSVLARLTAANTDANGNGNGRPAST
ncbi:hypothetical protein ONS95_008408 [Cadophora gregata]|uniref:uncharacterized protein n=1 Tax=Cadophora gregata TaxID=51156 RepID=UPI0026DD5A90|nr:uncharacterized protein ONS95_008408 [Cadophora gregata]KAK0126829.1 hypothetical protein ONS95_008408 [Cadophora gregata]